MIKKKKIGIISGKGGVGKTSLAASLASLTRNDPDTDAIVMDCDVDAPNLALILPPANGNGIKSLDTFTTLKATFLESKCVNCKLCYEEHLCEFHALKWDDEHNIPIVDYLACEGCGACKVLCPEHAFEIKTVKSGEIISYKTELEMALVYGKTRLGSTTSGKLVSDVKEYAETLDDYSRSNSIIIDGPPGIGCPVIATLSGLDYVITITEPTPSGLHDVSRAIEVVQQFNIPFGIIINKYDIDSPFKDKFNKFLIETDYYVLGRIPFDFSIPEAMSYGKPVVDFNPTSKASSAIKDIYERLKIILKKND